LLFTSGAFVAKLSVTFCALINPLNFLPTRKSDLCYSGLGGCYFPLAFINSEHAELEDETRTSPSPGKGMAIRGDYHLLSEENLKNIGQVITQ
jgi:hypothetical protein